MHMMEVALFFDKELRGAIEDLMICGGLFFGSFIGNLFLYLFSLGVYACIL